MINIFKGSDGRIYRVGQAFRTLSVDCVITINPLPVDATVVLTATGYTQVGNSITVKSGTEVSYSVSKTGYPTITGSFIASMSQTLSVILYPEVDLGDYEYSTTAQNNVTLNKYIGLSTDVTTPNI